MRIRRSKYFRRGRYCVEFLAGMSVASAGILAAFVRWCMGIVKAVRARLQKRTPARADSRSTRNQYSQAEPTTEGLALQALLKLGFSKTDARRRIDAIDSTSIGNLSVEELVAGALQGNGAAPTSPEHRRTQA